jgi:hypothetical protein
MMQDVLSPRMNIPLRLLTRRSQSLKAISSGGGGGGGGGLNQQHSRQQISSEIVNNDVDVNLKSQMKPSSQFLLTCLTCLVLIQSSLPPYKSTFSQKILFPEGFLVNVYDRTTIFHLPWFATVATTIYLLICLTFYLIKISKVHMINSINVFKGFMITHFTTPRSIPFPQASISTLDGYDDESLCSDCGVPRRDHDGYRGYVDDSCNDDDSTSTHSGRDFSRWKSISSGDMATGGERRGREVIVNRTLVDYDDVDHVDEDKYDDEAEEKIVAPFWVKSVTRDKDTDKTSDDTDNHTLNSSVSSSSQLRRTSRVSHKPDRF